jgi:hypothetical protein
MVLPPTSAWKNIMTANLGNGGDTTFGATIQIVGDERVQGR